ncbi:MAG: hypothetical protein HWE18_03295 [Gammaproteobacteria bacterium]|nr:hypothetical protein [Gammaproteobacteria bacterium]
MYLKGFIKENKSQLNGETKRAFKFAGNTQALDISEQPPWMVETSLLQEQGAVWGPFLKEKKLISCEISLLEFGTNTEAFDISESGTRP